MELEFAQELCQLNNRFYRTWASSFSDTRHNIWPGWIRCIEETGLITNCAKSKNIDIAENSSQGGFKAQNGLNPNTNEAEGLRKPLVAPVVQMVNDCSKTPEKLKVIDVACGNLRFEEFLARSFPHKQIRVLALDSCDELALTGKNTTAMDVEFRHCDTMQALQNGNLDAFLGFSCKTAEENNNIQQGKTLQQYQDQKAMQLTVSFGFMHHIPLPEWRTEFVNTLLQATETGGFVCLSFWRFMNSPSIAAKAIETHSKGISELRYRPESFNEGDYLLGWKNKPGAYRYCHSFSTEEISELIAGTSETATTKARFQADGRTGSLNEYLVLQKR